MNKKLLLQLSAITLFSTILVVLWFYQPTPPPKPEPVVSQPEPPPKPAPVVKKIEPTPKPPEPPIAKTTPVLPALRFTPQAGQTLAYHFTSSAQSHFDARFLAMSLQPAIFEELDDNTEHRSPEHTLVNISNQGELYLKYYPYQVGAWQVAARIELTEYLLNGNIPAYADPIQYPFAFKMDALGRIGDYQFVKDIPTETQTAIKAILKSMQTQLAVQRQYQWQTEEKDGTGTYQAEYRWLNPDADLINLQKTKTDYLSTVAGQHGIMGNSIDIQQSEAHINLQPDAAWILSVNQQEHVDTVANGYTWSSYRYQFQAQRVDRDAQPAFPNDFNTFLTWLDEPQYRMGHYYATSQHLNAISRNLDLNAALDKYLELKNSDNYDVRNMAEKFFVNYLRLFPQAVFELVDTLNADPWRDRFDEKTHLVLWRLITEAGHTEAQQALAQAALNTSNTEITRIRAVIYSPDFTNPQPFLSESLWELYGNVRDSVEPSDVELQNMTIYAIGNVGYKDRLNYQRPSSIGQQLITTLEETTDTRETVELLGSIGNYGGSEIIPDVEPYFIDPDPNIRAAAYDTLRRMNDTKATEVLIDFYELEPNQQVRQSALFSLSQMQPNDNAMAWARKKVTKIKNADNQMLMITVLGKHIKDYPENEQTLRNFINPNLKNTVKREIYKYIQPEPPQTNND